MEENISDKAKLPSLDYRIPKWDLDELKERICPICNNDNSIHKHIRPDSLNVRLCCDCNTYFISPAPSEQQLSLFYSKYDENHRRESNISPAELILSYKDINPMADFRIQEISKHLSLLKSKILDIGFGRAQFLYNLMKLGAIPYGIELDDKALEYAKALRIDNVFKGTIADMDNKIKFNLIILNDLIEHPLDPIHLLKKAYDLLEDKGLLLIWTPNGGITENETYPITFRVDLEHMQYLTTKSCINIAKDLNLKIVHLETLGFPYLIDIDKPRNTKPNAGFNIKKAIKLIPFASTLYNVLKNSKEKLMPHIIEDKKNGTYHLFCIMQKS
jgi:2-polyprenyl-3-methyl-5-hydroxy-6-metoxy-1,4-benzoquinol methylase